MYIPNVRQILRCHVAVIFYVNKIDKHKDRSGHGGGQLVSMLAFYSDDPNWNPAEVYNLSVKCFCKEQK